MNCQQIALVLDNRDIRRLEAGEHAAVHTHLAACGDCARAWRAHSRLVARAIAPMPPAVPDRLWRALRAARMAERAPRRFGGRALTIGLLMAGAAAAAIFGMRSPDPAQWASENASGVSWSAPVEIEAQPSTETVLPPFAGTVDGQPAPNREGFAATQEGRFVVLPTLYEHDDPAAKESVDKLRLEFLALVREHTDAVVIELTEEQAASAPFPLTFSYAFRWLLSLGKDASLRAERDSPIGIHFGAQQTVRFSSHPSEYVPAGETAGWNVGFTHVRYRDGRQVGGSFSSWHESSIGDSVADRRRAESQRREVFADPSAVEASVHDHVRAQHARKLFRDTFPVETGELYASLIADARFPENERVKLLGEVSACLGTTRRLPTRPWCLSGERLRGQPARGLEGGPADRIIAAAVELGRSGAAETRRAVWGFLGPTGHPAVTQSMTDALLYDSDVTVRLEALDELQKSADDPFVRAALESAAAGDASPVVRRQARWAVMNEAERAAFVEAAVRDTSLSVDERAAIVIMEFRSRATPSFHLERPSLDLLWEAAHGTRDPSIKSMALLLIGRSAELSSRPEFVELLLASVDDPSPEVRREAISRLAERRDDPAAMEAVRRAMPRPEPRPARRWWPF